MGLGSLCLRVVMLMCSFGVFLAPTGPPSLRSSHPQPGPLSTNLPATLNMNYKFRSATPQPFAPRRPTTPAVSHPPTETPAVAGASGGNAGSAGQRARANEFGPQGSDRGRQGGPSEAGDHGSRFSAGCQQEDYGQDDDDYFKASQAAGAGASAVGRATMVEQGEDEDYGTLTDSLVEQ